MSVKNVVADKSIQLLKMSDNAGKNEELGQLYCRSISKSIADVIRFSLDESFRKRSFELFGVCCTVDTEKEIHKKLTTLIENKTLKKSQDIEDGDFIEVDPPDASPDTSADNVTESQSKSVKRNWVQISSQRYRESIKRQRTFFYSQPYNRKGLFGYNYQPSFEPMPTSSSIGSNSYYEEKLKECVNSNHTANIRYFSQ